MQREVFVMSVWLLKSGLYFEAGAVAVAMLDRAAQEHEEATIVDYVAAMFFAGDEAAAFEWRNRTKGVSGFERYELLEELGQEIQRLNRAPSES